MTMVTRIQSPHRERLRRKRKKAQPSYVAGGCTMRNCDLLRGGTGGSFTGAGAGAAIGQNGTGV